MTNDPTRPEARAPRGFNDRRARDLTAERQILAKVSKVYERYGFEAFDTGALEYADALGKFLPDADRPNEGVFALQDDDEQWMALRYDLTAPLARFVAQNWDGLPKPFRRYAFGTVWRNEKPGPGRFREFTQCDADTVGSARPEADAEIIAMAVEGMRAAGLPRNGYVIKINNRKLLNGLLSSAGVFSERQKLAVLRAIDKLDRLGTEGVGMLLGKGRLDESGAYTVGAELDHRSIDRVLQFVGANNQPIHFHGKGGNFLKFIPDRSAVLNRISNAIGGSLEGDEGLEELHRIDQALKNLCVDEARAQFDPSIVRGLEYYTGPVFEAELSLQTTDDKGLPVSFGSVGGGGRYDDLVARFTGKQIPSTGFSFGVSRLAAALRATKQNRLKDKRGPVLVLNLSDADMPTYIAAVNEIRSHNIPCEMYLGTSGMGPQMKYADRRKSPAAVIIGGDEIQTNTVTVKNLDLGKRMSMEISDNTVWREQRPGQANVPRDQLVAVIKHILGTGK